MQAPELNYTITPYKNLLESFVILNHHHLDCTSLNCSTLAISWTIIVRPDKGFSPLSLTLGVFCLAIAPEELRLLRTTGACIPLNTSPSLMLLVVYGTGWLVSPKFLREHPCNLQKIKAQPRVGHHTLMSAKEGCLLGTGITSVHGRYFLGMLSALSTLPQKSSDAVL